MAEPLGSADPREVGGYRLRARLGAGGMGQVYLATTPAGRLVAIKMIRSEFGDDPRFRARFRQEVTAAQRVHGLFTAQVLDADPDAPRPWLATSYVPGLSLQQAVQAAGPLPRLTVLLLIAGIAEALDAIHAVGIIHRDLKPANVILAADGPRVIDFGIARAAAAPALTLTGARLGSPRFMAPEQARAEPTTPAVDVFALGSLAGYAMTGHPPFGADSAPEVLNRVLSEAPNLADCPADLRALIERCLVKDPAARPRPGDIIKACQDLAGERGLSFDRSWLPATVSGIAAASAPARPDQPSGWAVLPPAAGWQEPADGEYTLGSESGSTGAAPPGPDTDQSVDPAADLDASPDARPAAAADRAGGRRRTVLAGLAGAAAALLAVAAVTVALLNPPATGGRRPHRLAPSAGLRASQSADGRPGAGPRRPSGTAVPSLGSSAPAQAGPTARPTSAATPASPQATATAAATGRPAFAGTWNGTVSQPGWTVPSWPVQLIIPATGNIGSYRAPSLGCSGTLRVTGRVTSTLRALAETTSALNTGCVHQAHLTLSLAGAGQLDLTWAPPGHQVPAGRAVLTRS